jgi:hypothetical protein
MLELFAVPQIDDDKMVFLRTMPNIVTEFLDETFPRRWIGKQWPPRSPDLTPLGCVKQVVYSDRIHKIKRLKQRIREAAVSFTPDVLGRVWQEMEYRLDVCRATSGAHIEFR